MKCSGCDAAPKRTRQTCGSLGSRLCYRIGALGERALPGKRGWHDGDAECRGCAGALLRGGFGEVEVRRGATAPLCVAKAGDAVVAAKQEGAQGFYKVWVSDAPIEAE